jgi:hypothetical protein
MRGLWHFERKATQPVPCLPEGSLVGFLIDLARRRGSAAAPCGKALPFREGWFPGPFPEAEPQEKKKAEARRKAIRLSAPYGSKLQSSAANDATYP